MSAVIFGVALAVVAGGILGFGRLLDRVSDEERGRVAVALVVTAALAAVGAATWRLVLAPP